MSEINRRGFIKHGAAVAAPLAGSSYFIGAPSRAQEPTLSNMLALWYGHAEPDVVAAFEAQYNCKIKPKYYTGGDNMLALVSQSPVGTYDLILSDAEYVSPLQKAGYIQLDTRTIRSMTSFGFQQFPGHWVGKDLYSVITRFGFLGVAYNTNAVSEAKARSYKVFWDPAYKGKVGHLIGICQTWGSDRLLNGNKARSSCQILNLRHWLVRSCAHK